MQNTLSHVETDIESLSALAVSSSNVRSNGDTAMNLVDEVLVCFCMRDEESLQTDVLKSIYKALVLFWGLITMRSYLWRACLNAKNMEVGNFFVKLE